MDTSKIIKGVVNSGRYTVTAPIVKEDYGLYLKIEGVELPSTYEVDFSNSEYNGTSVTMIGNSDGVLIPSQFISSGKNVFAFLHVVESGYGRTVYKFRIPNKLRPDRTNIAPTPEEQSVIDQTISALNSAVAQTAQDVISADQSAQSASQFAEDARDAEARAAARAVTAKNHADRAEQARDNAQTYANNASASATASAQSASEAQTASTNAETYALNSGNKAVESAQSASASANSASQAQGYAQSASASANSASGYASQADISANMASNKASEASQSAIAASDKATESAQSASQAFTYKTDAESAKTASQTAQGLAESARDSAISAKNDAEQIKTDVQNIADGIDTRLVDVENDVIKAFPTDTASGAVASFSDGADDIPLKSLVIDINPVQDLSHGDPSPENICPISGWTQVDVEQSGKNLFNPNTITEGSFIRAANTSDAFPLGGVNANVAWNCSDYIPVLPSTQYTQIVPYYNSAGAAGLVFFASKTVESAISGVPTLTQGNQKYTFTTPSNCHYIRVSYNNGNLPTDFPYPVVALGSDVSGFIASDIHSITINLGQTVYGGKLDVLSGELVIDRAMLTVTECSSVSTASTGVLYVSVSVATGTTAKAEAPSNKNISSVYKYRVNAPTDGGWFRVVTSNIYIFDNRFTDKATADTILSTEQPVFVYELVTPITIQLTPNQVNSLLGVNNIWADSGDTEVEYRADTKAYIAKKIAEAISALS